MTHQEIKQLVLAQYARERKIVLLNIILVVILAALVMALFWSYASLSDENDPDELVFPGNCYPVVVRNFN